MKKNLMFLLLVAILPLSSCTLGGGRAMIVEDGEQKADTRIEQILEALKNKDQDALRAMFSKQALDEVDDFDGSSKYLLDFFQGNVGTWNVIDSHLKQRLNTGKSL